MLSERNLEIIHLRALRLDIRTVRQAIIETLKKHNICDVTITLYNRINLSSDIAIHIHHENNNSIKSLSDIGICLAQSLKPYGMVDHTCWKEFE